MFNRLTCVLTLILFAPATAGCTAESLRLALANQQRADAVQHAVFDRQHDALCLMLYRDTLQNLKDQGVELDDAQRQAIAAAFSDRDLLEFWQLQFEKGKALRLIGVDAKLFADQAPLDLLIKSAEAKWDRAKAAYGGTALAEVLGSHAIQNAATNAAKGGGE